MSIDEIETVLESSGTFRVNKRYQSEFTIKIERLQYQGPLGQPGNIKIEVDTHQNVLLPGITTEYRNVWRINTTTYVMNPKEICAEKIRAVSQRARYRDFYDLYFLIKEFDVNFYEVVNILKMKEIRSPITVANIAENWAIAKEQLVGDLGAIYCSEELAIKDIEDLIQIMQFEDIGNPHFGASIHG
jgi:predicted nucleotidyltransferase component of viral defense system